MVVDIIKIDYHFFKSSTKERIYFGEMDKDMIPHKGDVIYVEGKYYSVEYNVFYPFGDANGVEGVQIYVNGDNIRVK